MLIPGLVSVTFRKLTPEEIIREASRARLQVVEWGGDIHAPPGHESRAKAIRTWCADAGLGIAAYGSYFRLAADQDVRPWLETAAQLGAPTMRIWAGNRASPEWSDSEVRLLVDELRTVCELGQRAGRTLSLEYHEGTFVDCLPAAERLLRSVDHPALRTYWQPLTSRHAVSDHIADITGLLPWLSHLHVFHRDRSTAEWRPFNAAAPQWRRIFRSIAASTTTHAVMIEFVRGDSIAALQEDAGVLRACLEWATAHSRS